MATTGGDSRASRARPPVKRVAAALIVRNRKILICQRTRHQPMPLKWEFPGGKADPGETPEIALVRELDEELSIHARIGGEITRYKYQYPGKDPILLIFYRILDFEGEPENRDFAQIRWEVPERLSDYDFLEGDAEFIRSLTPRVPPRCT